MSCKSILVTFAVLGSLLAPMQGLAQIPGDAGVSGIPRGPGSVGGLNNSGNDPSGIGNAARVQPPPPPSMAVPVVPSGSPVVSSRLSPRYAPVVRIKRRGKAVSRRESRRGPVHAETRARDKQLDRKLDRTLNICRGC
jgi:hypothetical protein